MIVLFFSFFVVRLVVLPTCLHTIEALFVKADLDESLPTQSSVGLEQRSLEYNPALDGLRGVAILLVVFHHLSVGHERESWGGWLYTNVKALGWIGVDLFFVLSGFLIGSILLKSYGRQRWIVNFVVRRALRVLPLYFTVIFFCFNVVTWLPFSGVAWLSDLAKSQVWYWLHLANFRKIYGDMDPSLPTVGWMSTYWSLSIEEHFYLMWPFVLWMCGPLNIGRVACLGLVGVVSLRCWIAMTDYPESIIYNNTFTRIDGLLLGTLIAWLNEFYLGRLKSAGYFVACVFVLAACAFLIPSILGYVGGGRQTTYGKIVLYTASVWGSGALVWYMVTQPSTKWLCRVFANRLLVSIGKYSYAIYVFNKPIIYGVAAFASGYLGKLPTLGALAYFVCVCWVCWIVAWVSWRLIEQPFLRLKVFFPSRTGSK